MKKSSDIFFSIRSVADYLKLRNQPLQHPLIGLVDFNKINEEQSYKTPSYTGLEFDCYAVFLKENINCKLKYGGGSYDFDSGTIVFIGPNQKIGITKDSNFKPQGYALLFHPDLLKGSFLNLDIKHYPFFSYSVNEALHLSEKEHKLIVDILKSFQKELNQNTDNHSKSILLSTLKLLLDYCSRFYERQFVTREHIHSSCLKKFKELLSAFYQSQNYEKKLPSVDYFAQSLHLSTNYFGDLIRKETGVSAQEYIQKYMIYVAKHELEHSELSIKELAYHLGFKYPQHFSRLFKKKTGLTPNQYKLELKKVV